MNPINLRSYNLKQYELSKNKRKNKDTTHNHFSTVLTKVQNGPNQLECNYTLKFSKHAKDRMQDRNIMLNSQQLVNLEKAFSKAERKGVKEALILMNDTAFIASIKQKTVITIMTSDQLLENTITNIDGAVIM